MRLSYSKLNTYRVCPLRYRFTYLDRLPRRPRRLFRAAKRVHHALMRWLTYARSGSPRWEDVRAAYDSAWGALQDPAVMDTRDYAEGLQILQDYHQANAERPCQPVYLEHRFNIPLGPHVLVGALDRVDATDTGVEVIDYKLDREIRSQEAVDSDLQLGLYALAVEEVHGMRPEALSLYFLRHNVQRTTLRTREESTELARWAIATGNDISSNRQWTPCPGDHCGGCDFRSSCPAHTGKPLAAFVETPRLVRERVDTQMSLLLPDEQPRELAGATGPARGADAPETQLSLPWM
jgi:RecB family exonuclease